MPDAHREHPVEAVEVLSSGIVPEVHPLPARDRQRRFAAGGGAGEQVPTVLLGGASWGGGGRFRIRHGSPSFAGILSEEIRLPMGARTHVQAA